MLRPSRDVSQVQGFRVAQKGSDTQGQSEGVYCLIATMSDVCSLYTMCTTDLVMRTACPRV